MLIWDHIDTFATEVGADSLSSFALTQGCRSSISGAGRRDLVSDLSAIAFRTYFNVLEVVYLFLLVSLRRCRCALNIFMYLPRIAT